MIIKEICLENYTLVPKALELGAKRIELCHRFQRSYGSNYQICARKKSSRHYFN